MKRFVHSLDLSLNSTGVCIFTNDGQFVESLTIDTNSEKETKLKLRMIGDEFIKIINVYPPSKVIIEQGFTLYNVSTQKLFRVHGIANYLYSDYEQIYYPATMVKATIGGMGNIKKEDLRKIILMEYPNIKFGSLDESDAFAVGKTYFIKEGVNKNAKENIS